MTAVATYGLTQLALAVRLGCVVFCALTAVPLAAQSRANDLVGTWRLLSFDVRDSSGAATYPMGRATKGLLVYDRDGFVSAHLMDPDRPLFAAGDRARGTDAEVRAAFVGYLAYFGRYSVDGRRRTVRHHIDGATFPNWIATDQLRQYRVEGNRLHIVTPPLLAGGRRLTTTLIWERAQ